jgi:Zn-dependent protease with chaperone function
MRFPLIACVVVILVGIVASWARVQDSPHPQPSTRANPPALTASQPSAATSAADATATAAKQAKPAGFVTVPEPSAKAMQYYRSGNVLWVVFQIVELAIPALLLFSGLSASLRNGAQFLGRKWLFVIGVYFLLYSVVDAALEFPLALYAGYFRQHAYGLSNQTFAKWLGDSFTMLAVELAFGCLLLWIPYLLLLRSPRRWWLYTSLFAVPVVIFFALIQPIWIAPLLNHFGPMKDKPLEAQILALADRAGIEGSRVFEVDKSVDTKAVNAYVTGFLGSKRIVLWDTLLTKLDKDEVLFVMAHEMGHYALNHILIGMLASCLGIFLVLYAVHRLAGALVNRYHRRFGFHRLSDVASFPLFVLLARGVALVILPAAMAFSRYQEHEADRFGLELTQNSRAAATAFVKLQAENLGNPRPGLFFTLWRGSHPAIADRIDFANTYRPWAEGEPGRYERLFHGRSLPP